MPRRNSVPPARAQASCSNVSDNIMRTFSPISSPSSSPRLVIIEDEIEEPMNRGLSEGASCQMYSTPEAQHISEPRAVNPQSQTRQRPPSDQVQREETVTTVITSDNHQVSSIPTVDTNNIQLVTTQAITLETYPSVLVPHLVMPASAVRTNIFSTTYLPTLLYDTGDYYHQIAQINSELEPNQPYDGTHTCRYFCSCDLLHPPLQNNIHLLDQRFYPCIHPNYEALRSEVNVIVHDRGISEPSSNNQHFPGLADFHLNGPHNRNYIPEQRYHRNIQLGIPFQNQNHVQQSGLLYRTMEPCFQQYRPNNAGFYSTLPNFASVHRHAPLDGMSPRHVGSHNFGQNDVVSSSISPNHQQYRINTQLQMGQFNPLLRGNNPEQTLNGSVPFTLSQPQRYSLYYPEANVMRCNASVNQQYEETSGLYNQTLRSNFSDQQFIGSASFCEPPQVVQTVIGNQAVSTNQRHCGCQPRSIQTDLYTSTLQNRRTHGQNATAGEAVVHLCCDTPDSEQTVTSNNQSHVQKCGREQSTIPPMQSQHGFRKVQRSQDVPAVDPLLCHSEEGGQSQRICSKNCANLQQTSSVQQFGRIVPLPLPQREKDLRSRIMPGWRKQTFKVPTLPNANQQAVYQDARDIISAQSQATSATLIEQRQTPNVATNSSISSAQSIQQTPSILTSVHRRPPRTKHAVQQNNPANLLTEPVVLEHVSQLDTMSILLPPAQRRHDLSPSVPLISSDNNLGLPPNTSNSAGGNRDRTKCSAAAKITSSNNLSASESPNVEVLAGDKEAPPVKMRKIGQIHLHDRHFKQATQQELRTLQNVADPVTITTASHGNNNLAEDQNSSENAAPPSSNMATTSTASAAVLNNRKRQESFRREKQRSSVEIQEMPPAYSVHMKSRR